MCIALCSICGINHLTPRTKVRACHECLARIQATHYNTMRPIPATPTDAEPGSPEKIRVMEERYRRGEHLHHPQDRTAFNRWSDVMVEVQTV